MEQWINPRPAEVADPVAPYRFGPIIFPFTGKDTGGSHISTFFLARVLTEEFGIPTIVVAVEGTNVAAEAERRGMNLRLVPAPHKQRLVEMRDFTDFMARRKLLASYGADAIVHCGDLWSLAAFGPPAKSLRLPLVYHNRTLNKGLLRDRLVVGMADAVICVSEAARNRLRGARPENVRVVMNPFERPQAEYDRKELRAEFEARWPIDGLQLVGWSGNFLHRKRADFFLRMAAAIASRNPRVRFPMFGRDRHHTTEELAALAESLGITDLVFLGGFRSPPERVLLPLDVLAVPALGEPFGRTLVEATFLGVPYVATDDAGATEMGKYWGGGLLVPKDASPEQFAEVVLELLENPKPAELSSAQQDKLVEDFRPRRHATQVIEVYERISR